MRRQCGPFEVKLTPGASGEPLRKEAANSENPPALDPRREVRILRHLRIVHSSSREHVRGTPYRNFDCPNYENCLGLAAALDWNSFTCRNCSGNINDQLLWRAYHIIKKDAELAELCDLPQLSEKTRTAAAERTDLPVPFLSFKIEKLP
jgi:hypothetical protein